MNTVPFDSFLPEVSPEVQGAPYQMVINAIRNACFDFCRESNWVSDVQASQAYLTGTANYTLTAPVDMMVSNVLALTLDDLNAIQPVSLESLQTTYPTWATATGPVATFTQLSPGAVTLVPIPDTDGTFVATVAYTPTRDATVVAEDLFKFHLETIKFGALWKLLSMVGQTWSNPTAAVAYETQFWQGVTQATIDRYRSTSRASLRVVQRPFV